MASRYLRPLAIVVMLVICEPFPRAAARVQPLREMHHSSWTGSDGAPQGITGLAQHPDGTLWIGSDEGLFNFDGRTFRLFESPPDGPAFPSAEVRSLLITRTGTIWAGFYRGGVARISEGSVRVFTHAEMEPLEAVQQLREAPDGSIWAIDGQWRLLRFGAGGTWRREPTPSSGPVTGIFADSANTLWLAQDGFLHTRPLTQASYTRTKVPVDLVTGFTETPGGDLWINDYDAKTSRGRTQQLRRMDLRVRAFHRAIPGTAASAPDGSVIIASSAFGVRRILPDDESLPSRRRPSAEPDVFARAHGLSSNAVKALTVDAQGNIWIGGQRGLDRLRPGRLTRFLPASDANGWAVCAGRRGEVWVANTRSEVYPAFGRVQTSLAGFGAPLFSLACADGGLAWFANNRGVWRVASGSIGALPEIPGARRRDAVKILVASDHTLYATVAGALDNGGGIWTYKRGRWAKLTAKGELGAGGYAAYIDRRDRLWVGSTEGRAILHSAAGAEMFGSGQPGLGYVHAFLDTSQGLLAAGSNGLAVWRGSGFEMLAFADSSIARNVRGLVEALDGDLWLNSASGLVHLQVTELKAALATPAHRMNARLFREGESSGAGAPQGVVTYLDTAARDSEGRLWFATRSGVVYVDPERIAGTRHQPRVAVRSLLADGQPVGGSRVLAPATRTVEVQYFGVDLTAPEQVVYRYRLEGFDESWQDAGHRTEAFYTRLAPGTYTFSVMASNGDGIWSAPVSTAPFVVRPHFYQTSWFAVAMAGLAVLIAGIVHRARVRQVSRVMRARFEERLAERTRVARDLHDTLLQTVHGSKLVADRALRDVSDREGLVRALEQLSFWMSQAATEGRAALQSLRSSTADTSDLAGAFRRAIDECRTDSNAHISLAVHGDAKELHPVARDEIYRIGYEAIRNACMHSQGSRIEVTLEYGHDLVLRILDNGIGLADTVIETGKTGHFGLRGMRERAARIEALLTVVSGQGSGTVVTLTVPGRVIERPI